MTQIPSSLEAQYKVAEKLGIDRATIDAVHAVIKATPESPAVLYVNTEPVGNVGFRVAREYDTDRSILAGTDVTTFAVDTPLGNVQLVVNSEVLMQQLTMDLPHVPATTKSE